MASLVPSEPQTTDPESITVVFKLPNGTRIERRFLKSNSLKVYFLRRYKSNELFNVYTLYFSIYFRIFTILYFVIHHHPTRLR